MNTLKNKIIYFIGIFALLSSVVHADRVFKYPRIKQEKDNWCWDACSQWILGFHGVELSQTDICKYGFTDGKERDQWNWIYTKNDSGGQIVSYLPAPIDWNFYTQGMPPMWDTCYGRGINIIINHFGVPFNVKGTSTNPANYILTEEEFKNEIDNGHPFVVRYQWDNNNGGHFVVAIGYQNKMCWLMNPWKDDGIQIYDFAWVKDGTDASNKHHVWDYTLQTTKVNTPPEMTADFPAALVAGQKYSIKLVSTLNGKDVSKCTFYTPLTEGVTIDSATGNLTWTQTEQGPSQIKIVREFGNATDTIVKSFGATGSNTLASVPEKYGIQVRKSGSLYTISVNQSLFSKRPIKIQLSAANGTVVFSQRVATPATASITIDRKTFASGMYFLSVSNGNLLKTERLIF
jgi:hypothetical protein